MEAAPQLLSLLGQSHLPPWSLTDGHPSLNLAMTPPSDLLLSQEPKPPPTTNGLSHKDT